MKEKILELAEQAKIKLTEEEIEKLEEELKNLESKYEVLNKIDIEGVDPLFSVLENEVSNRFLIDEENNLTKEKREKIFDRDKMLDDFYQVKK